MANSIPVAALSDHDLLERLHALVCRSNEVTANLIEHLAEVDRRKLHLVRSPSLHDYCVRRLGLSDAAAYKRIAVARLAQRFAEVIERLRAGRLHLSAALTLGPHLTHDNCAELMGLAEGMTQREIERLIAVRFPKPDVRESVRKLPAKAGGHERAVLTGQPPVAGSISESIATPPELPAFETRRTAKSGRPPTNPSATADAGRLEALSASSYSVKFTASERLHEKIREAQALVSHTLPRGELAALFELALDLLIAEQKKRRFGIRPQRSLLSSKPKVTTKARVQGQSKRSRYVPVAVKREVAEREGFSCAYVDPDGVRCSERRFLEFEHKVPYARGGKSDSETLRLYCRGHNQLLARREFGAEHIQRAIETRRARTCHERQAPPLSATPGADDHSS